MFQLEPSCKAIEVKRETSNVNLAWGHLRFAFYVSPRAFGQGVR